MKIMKMINHNKTSMAKLSPDELIELHCMAPQPPQKPEDVTYVFLVLKIELVFNCYSI